MLARSLRYESTHSPSTVSTATSVRATSIARTAPSARLIIPPYSQQQRTFILSSWLSSSGWSKMLPGSKGHALPSTWPNIAPRSPNDPLLQAAIKFKEAVTRHDNDVVVGDIRQSYEAFIELFKASDEDTRVNLLGLRHPNKEDLSSQEDDDSSSGASTSWFASFTSPGLNRRVKPPITSKLLFEAILKLTNNGEILPARKAKYAQDVEVARQIDSDTFQVFGWKRTKDQYAVILRAWSLIDPKAALRWLQSGEAEKNGDFRVNGSGYEIVMRGFAARGDRNGMRHLLDAVRSQPEIRVSSTIYAPYVLAAFPLDGIEGLNPHDIGALVKESMEEMAKDGFSPSASLLSDLILEFRKGGDLPNVTQYAKELKLILSRGELSSSTAQARYAAAALVSAADLSGGHAAALQEALDLKADNIQHGLRTLNVLIECKDGPVYDAPTLIALADQLDVELVDTVFASAITRAIERGHKEAGVDGLSIALGIYQESQRRGVRANAMVVEPLLNSFCTRHSPPLLEDVTQALEIYYDLRDALGMTLFESSSPSSSPSTLRSGPQSTLKRGPDRATFSTLLKAIYQTHKPSENTSDLIIQLLIDMREFKVKLEPNFIQNVFSSLLLISDSHDSAFRLYSYLREIDPSVLNSTGYPKILEQFARLSFEEDPLPSQTHYLDIVRDMRDAGFPMTPYIYTVLFTRYAALASQLASFGSNESSMSSGTSQTYEDKISEVVDPSIHSEKIATLQDHLLSATRRLHLTLKIDASITPDTPSLNALMNVYNRLGSYGEAFQVWEQLLYGSPTYDNASISIILDVCGFAWNEAMADTIWSKVRRVGADDGGRRKQSRVQGRALAVIPNENNWASLIECYARTGNFAKAMDAFQEMIRASKDPSQHTPRPNAVVAGTLLKFAWSYGQTEEVERLIQSELPDLYTSLPKPNPNRPPR